MKLTYQIPTNAGMQTVVQRGSISNGQDYAFKVPFAASYDGDVGCTLEVNAVAGINVLRIRVRSNPECIDVWGTTLIPYWTHMDCKYIYFSFTDGLILSLF